MLGKRDELVQRVADRPGHVRRHAVDSGRFRWRTGWRPRTRFAEGLEATVRWDKANPESWKPLRAPMTQDYAATWARMAGSGGVSLR